jgi:hypothetical protein
MVVGVTCKFPGFFPHGLRCPGHHRFVTVVKLTTACHLAVRNESLTGVSVSLYNSSEVN